MTVRNPLLAWPALAVGGLLLSAGDAPAFFFHHHGGVYKQRTVIRGGHGGAPVVYGAPAARVGPVTRTEFFPLAPTFGTEFYRLGAAEYYPLTTGAEFYPLGGLRSAQESALLDAIRAESGRLSSKGSSGGATAPAPSTGCPELAGRLDKIETRLGTLETRLAGIEAKVDGLMAERKERSRVEEQARLVEQIVTAVNNRQEQIRLENNRALVGLIEELAKPAADRNKERVDALRKALTGQ